MTFANWKAVAVALWALALGVAVVISRPSSASDLALLGAIAIAGLVFLAWLWRRPEQTMSESIQNARR